jgi:hypothetical protein
VPRPIAVLHGEGTLRKKACPPLRNAHLPDRFSFAVHHPYLNEKNAEYGLQV